MAARTRGSFGFEVNEDGDLLDSRANVDKLRRLWLDRALIDGEDLGPGDPGDFDHGAWHVACHLVAAAGVRRAADGRLLWLELSHHPTTDGYVATVSFKEGRTIRTDGLATADGRAIVNGSTLLGFVEGNSVGHISARGSRDPSDRFNGWRRQQFDQPINSPRDGGKVWEHWCTVRDIRPSHAIGSSVLEGYVSLAATLGDLFIPTVARGRREYGHPQQLRAMVRAGLTAERSATWNTTPIGIPSTAERRLLEATVAEALTAIEALDWNDPPWYYMFERRLGNWSAAASVGGDLATFPP